MSDHTTHSPAHSHSAPHAHTPAMPAAVKREFHWMWVVGLVMFMITWFLLAALAFQLYTSLQTLEKQLGEFREYQGYEQKIEQIRAQENAMRAPGFPPPQGITPPPPQPPRIDPSQLPYELPAAHVVQSVNDQQQTITRLEERLNQLEEQTKQASSQAENAIAEQKALASKKASETASLADALSAINAIRTAVTQGQSFQALLSTLRSAQLDEEAQAQFKALEALSAKPYLSLSALSTSYRADVVNALYGTSATENSAESLLNEHVKIRKVGDKATSPRDRALNAAEAALQQGSIDALLESLKGLEESDRKTIAPYLAKAEQLQNILNALATLETSLQRQLRSPSAP